MARVEKTVFISYRRADVYTALAVYQDLTAKGYDVFFDYTSIPSGDFEQIIISNIKARAHFVLILTPTALDRCNEPGDWLRREIETAIDEKRNIIPLFFKGFKFGIPSVSEKLTGKLGNVSRYNGLNVHEDYFHAAMDRLSDQFLNVPTDAVLHPISIEVQKVVKEVQIAADKALKKGSKLNLRSYGIVAGILLIAALGFFGISSLASNAQEKITPTTTQTVGNTISVESFTNSPVATVTLEPQTPTPTDEPTPTIAPSPTLSAGSTKISPLTDGMVMVFVPAGEFKMGTDNGESDERPVHDVYLDAFWMYQTEVTNKMYLACMRDGKCQEPKNDAYLNPDLENHPVVYVNWDDANNYCSWAGGRLPTEAEWEKTASWNAEKQSKSIFPWGDNLNCTFANYYDTNQQCMGATTAVGSYPKGKSPYEALDMAGNVSEWVSDRYQNNYYDILESFTSNPKGPSNGDLRVLRGGSWFSYNSDIRSTERHWSAPSYESASIGFRCVMDASE